MLNVVGQPGFARHATLLPVHPESRPATARPPASGLIEFFRHHGLWAPGVRLFRRMRFAAKASVVSAVFLIPVITLGVSVFSDKAAAIAFASKERDGVAYLREAAPLLQLAERQRLLVAQGSAAAPLGALRREIAARSAGLKRVEQQFGTALGTQREFEAAMQAAQAAGGAPSALADALSALIDRVADGSNLSLDPGLDTLYLMNTVVTNLPTVADKLVTQAAVAAAPSSPDQLGVYQTAQALGELSSQRMKNELGKVYSVQPEYAAQFHDDEVRGQVQAIRQRALDAAGATPAQTAEALQGLWELEGMLIDRLDELLAARVGQMKLWRDVVAAIVAVSLLLAAYLFYAFFLVTHGGLREVEKHLQAMTAGDLTTHPAPWGRDDAAWLMVALAEMQASLRSIVSKVRSSAAAIVAASTEIAGASLDLSSRTEQTAANLEQSAASMEQIAAAAKQTAAHSQHAAIAATENAAAASRGGSAIAQVVATMRDIHASSAKISDIIGTIDGIAFQTNILALNAAVEAARAGEQGRGFAVVAAEVRSLAQRSAGAAREVKSLITESTTCVDSGAKTVSVAGETMTLLLETAQQTKKLLAEISGAAVEQSEGVAQVGTAVTQLERMTQQNATLVEQSTAAAAALKSQAEHLAAEVARFRLP